MMRPKLARRVGSPGQNRARNWRGASFEMGQLPEDLKTGVDLIASEILEPFRAKALDGKRSHDAAVKESALDDLAIDVLLGSDVSHKTAGEGIARAGRVLYLFEGQCRSAERMTAH